MIRGSIDTSGAHRPEASEASRRFITPPWESSMPWTAFVRRRLRGGRCCGMPTAAS